MHSDLQARCELEFTRYVTELCDSKPDRWGQIAAQTPWCDAHTIFERGIPQLKCQIRAALEARVWFSKHGPGWAQPLPLAAKEYVAMLRGGGPCYLLGCYSFSLQQSDYDYLVHPQLYDFCRGVMASSSAPEYVRDDPQLLAEFPPMPLRGLHRLVWYGENLQADRLIDA